MFKPLLKLCYCPIRTFALIILVTTLILGSIIAYIFKTGNTGKLLKQELLTTLQNQGLQIEFESIEFNPTTGIVLHNVFWHGSSKTDAFFIQAKEVTLGTDILYLSSSEQKIKSVSVKSGLASFYFSDKKQPLHFSNINFNLNLNQRSWDIYDSSLHYSTCKIEYKGTITNPKFNHNASLDVEELISQILSTVKKYYNQTLQFKEINPVIWEQVDKMHTNSVKQNYKINANVTFNIPWNNPLKGAILSDFKIPAHLIRGVQIRGIEGTLIFSKNNISTENIKVAIDEDEYVNLNASYNLVDRKLSANAEVQIYPERASTMLTGYLPTVAKYAKLVKSFGKPVNALVTLPEQFINSKELYVNVDVDANDIIYDTNLTINELRGSLTVNSNSLDFNIKKAVFNNQKTSGTCSGFYFFRLGELILATQVTGDPSFASSFMPKFVADIYLQICNSFKWHKDSPPSFNFSLRNAHSFEYITQLNGTISMAGCELLGTPIKMLQTGLSLQMTGEDQYALLHDLSLITQNNKSITGNGVYDFASDKTFGTTHFSANSTAPPAELFNILTLDNFADAIPFLNFKDGLNYSIDGTYDFDRPELSAIKALVNSESVEIFECNLQKATATVSYIGDRLIIDNIKGDLCDGPATSRFEYDFNTDKSALNLKANDVHISQLPTMKGRSSGRADINLNLGMQFIENSETPTLSGSGRVSIDEGNFWKIPLLSLLANSIDKILPTKGLGEITEIKSKLKFSNHTIKIRDLKTNGSIISFKGDGEIDLAKKHVDLVLETRPLADVLWSVIPVLLRPITKSVQLKLEGPYEKLKWKPTSGLW